MNEEEIQSLIKQLKAAGLDDDQIMDIFYETFTKGEMDRKDLEILTEAMGYELTDDFKNDAEPDPIDSPNADADVDDGKEMSKEELEDAKTIEPEESKEDFKEKLGIDDDGGDDDFDGDVDDDDDEKEWDEAQKMFKI